MVWHGGYAAAVPGGFPVDHAFGVEVVHCRADAGAWSSGVDAGGCGEDRCREETASS